MRVALTVVIIAGLGCLAWYLVTKKDIVNTLESKIVNRNTNTPSVNTTDWKTYSSNTYGFSFKYPGDWEITKDNIDNANRDAIGGGKEIKFAAARDSATLGINFEGGFEGVSYYKKGSIKNGKISIVQNEDWSQKFAANTVKQMALYIEKFDVNDSMIFVYNFQGDSNTATALFDQIISSFRFN